MHLVCWMDKKLVSLLASELGEIARNTINSEGRYKKIQISQPKVVSMYNKGMGGTDHFDQFISNTRSSIKTFSWVPKVLLHFVHVAAVNAFILFKIVSRPKPRYSMTDFTVDLVHALAADEFTKNNIDVNSAEDADIRNRSLKQWKKDLSRLNGKHFGFSRKLPDEEIERQRQLYGKKAHTQENGHCMLCKKGTSNQCDRCDIFLYSVEVNGTTC
jgi:hypothetical protein